MKMTGQWPEMIKDHIKKRMGVLFFLAMFTGVLFGVLPGTQVVAKAAGPWDSGGCTVTLSGTTLTVSKTSGKDGRMANYEKNGNICPWRGQTVNNIIISADVNYIGTYAFVFTDVTAVTSVTINSTTITEIPEGAFFWNSSLKQISLPSSVTTIGKEAFYQCEGLTSITAKGVQTIGESAFGNNYSLASVSIPAVTQIGEEAFFRCKGMTSVSFPAVKKIGARAFRFCYSLKNVTLSSVITSIGDEAFTLGPHPSDNPGGSIKSSLKNLTIYTETPPTLGSFVFNNIPSKQADLTVPTPSKYQNATDTQWKTTFNIEQGHVHSFSYSASANTITATCNGSGTCPVGKQTLTLAKKNNKIYDGNAVTVPTYSLTSGWTTANGLTLPGDVTVSPANSADVGKYTASVTVKTATAESSWTISQADNPLTYDSTQSVTKTFSKSSQTATLAAATKGQGTVNYAIQSQTGGNYFTLNGTTLTIAGNTPANTYTVIIRATAAGNKNYKSGTKDSTVTVKVNPASLSSVTPPTASAITYGQALSESTLSGGSATFDGQPVEVSFDWADGTIKPAVADSGTTNYTVTVTPAYGNYAATTCNVTLTVEPRSIADATVVLNLPSDLVYDGNPKTVSVNSVTLTDGTTLGAGDYDADGLTATEGGEHTVTVTGKGNYTDSAGATWTITSADLSIDTLPTAADITYGQTLSESALTGGVVKFGDIEVPGKFTWIQGDTKPEVADSDVTLYPIVFTPDNLKNYNPIEDKLTLKVLPAPGPDPTDDEKPMANEDLVYTGEEQPLVTEPKELPEGYTKVQYSIDGGKTWTDEVPMGTDADTYTVNVKYIGDDNHLDFEGDPISVTISQASGPELPEDEKPTANEGLVYTGDELPLVTGPKELPEGYTGILYSIDGGKTWTNKIPTASEPGEYTVMTKYIGDDNHTDFIGESLKVTIQGAAYSIFSASGAEHVINEETDAVFTVKRSTEDSRTYTLYTGSSVDEGALPEGSNTTAEGSLILTLKASYLNTLAVGDHKVTISFKDGSVETTLKIKSAEPTPTPKPKPVPKTGDSAPLGLWIGLILVGLIGLGTFIALRRRTQKK